MWINPSAWKQIESQKKAQEEAEQTGVESSEGGFLGFERENAEFENQIARSDVAGGVFVADEETAAILAKQGEKSRQEWNAAHGSADSPLRRGVSPTGSSFTTPSDSEVELAKKAEEFVRRHQGGDSSAALLAEVLGRAVRG